MKIFWAVFTTIMLLFLVFGIVFYVKVSRKNVLGKNITQTNENFVLSQQDEDLEDYQPTDSMSIFDPDAAYYDSQKLQNHATLYANLVYNRIDGKDLKIDLYIPKNKENLQKIGKSTKTPVIVFVHGGGWDSGNENMLDPVRSVPRIVQNGYAVATLNYRLAPKYKFPAPIDDLKQAIEYLKKNGSKYSLDVEKIGLFGASAGAHIASWVGLASDPSLGLDAVVSIAAPFDLEDPELLAKKKTLITNFLGRASAESASPINLISWDDPAFLLVHGDRDEDVPLSQSQKFYDALKNKGVEAELLVVKNGDHSLNSPSGNLEPTQNNIQDKIVKFFNQKILHESEEQSNKIL